MTAPSYEFPPGFLISTSSNVTESGPAIFYITPGDAVPTLLPADIEKINNTLAQDKKRPIPDLIASQITGAKDSKPDVGRAWKGKQPRQCSYCEKAYDKNLMQCSRFVTGISQNQVLTMTTPPTDVNWCTIAPQNGTSAFGQSGTKDLNMLQPEKGMASAQSLL